MSRVALVTGGSRGIGRAVCRRLAETGAAVVVNYHHQAEAAQAVVEAIQAGGGQARASQADVSDPAQVESMVQQTLEHFGRIDILVNNAGINIRKSLLDTTDEEWAEVFRVNCAGPFYGTRAVARQMIAQGDGGRIINISSILALLGMEKRLAYSASKAALEAFTRCCAQELAPFRITVNAVAPGTTNTEINRAFLTPPIQKRLEQRISLGRIAEPEEIAAAVAFLASAEASYITGQVIRADGGWSTCDPVTVQRQA